MEYVSGCNKHCRLTMLMRIAAGVEEVPEEPEEEDTGGEKRTCFFSLKRWLCKDSRSIFAGCPNHCFFSWFSSFAAAIMEFRLRCCWCGYGPRCRGSSWPHWSCGGHNRYDRYNSNYNDIYTVMMLKHHDLCIYINSAFQYHSFNMVIYVICDEVYSYCITW